MNNMNEKVIFDNSEKKRAECIPELPPKTQSRRYLLTFNNYNEHGFSVNKIKDIAASFNPVYLCLSEEIGAEGTPHVHLYLEMAYPVRFATIKRRFPTAHIDIAYGTPNDVRNYVRKEGKYSNTEKAETRVEGSFYEWGDIKPLKLPMKQTMPEVIALINAGKTNMEIISMYPEYAFKTRDLDGLRESILAEKYMVENRDVTVHYVYGDTGTGKTFNIFKNHNPRDICRITDYSGPFGVRFDAYHGQKVLVLEEFHGQIDLPFLLNLLDRYPLMLPARYTDRVACFTEVYITSNAPLDAHYNDWRGKSLETYNAFLRRISDVTHYTSGAEASVMQLKFV